MASNRVVMFSDDKFFHSKYRLADKEPIGTGNFSSVYLIEDLNTKNKFALKAMLTNQLVKSKSEELNILSKTNHLNIVRFIESFQEGIMLCIVMEFCQNGDLEIQIKQAKSSSRLFSNELVFQWTCEMISAINYLHNYKIMHRSIKPANILLDSDNVTKLADFGDAVYEGHVDNLTETAGSYKYMSPEMKELLKSYSLNTDVWSVGCIVFELIKLEAYYDYVIYNKIQKSENFEIPYLNETTPILNKLLKMMLVYNKKERASSQRLMTEFISKMNYQL